MIGSFRNFAGVVALVCCLIHAQSSPAATLDTFAVTALPSNLTPPVSAAEISGKNNLKLRIATTNGSNQWGTVSGQNSATQCSYNCGFLLRDAKAGTAAVPVSLNPVAADAGAFTQQGDISSLNIRFSSRYEPFGEGIRISGSITDLKLQDRAITVYYVLPFSKTSATWFDDLRSKRAAPSSGEITASETTSAGATGKYDSLPVCAFANSVMGISLASPLNEPRLVRLGYSADTQQLYIAMDFGLVAETTKFPRRADFSFTVSSIEPVWGFRSALQRYYASFPEIFTKRTKTEGIWLYSDITQITNPLDFGFMFDEITGNKTKATPIMAADDTLGIMSFRYISPIPYNVSMSDIPIADRTYADLLAKLDSAQKAGNVNALAQTACGVKKADQTYWYKFLDATWVDGAQLIQNVDPDLPNSPYKNRAHINYDPLDAGGWYKSTGKQFEPQTGLDGEYLDSLEMFSGALDFGRDHYPTSDYPLTFAKSDKSPCLVIDWPLTKYVKWEADNLHSKGKMIMANGQPGSFPFVTSYLDAVGREVHWISGGTLIVEDDAKMNKRRSTLYQKPFLMLLNDDFTQIDNSEVEYYFKHSLFYGFYPSMFVYSTKVDGKWVSRYYFKQPELYNRDRALFQKYIPLIRMIGQAGWQPVTGATASDSAIWLERFGPDKDGKLYITARNTAAADKNFTLSLDLDKLQLVRVLQAYDHIRNKVVFISNGNQLTVSIAAGDVALIEVDSGSKSLSPHWPSYR